MTRIKSLDELKNIRDYLQADRNRLEDPNNPDRQVQIKVAMATCGIASGAKDIKDFLIAELSKRNISSKVTQTGCMGYCYAEPTIEVKLPGREPVVFGFVDRNKADEIIEKYIKKEELVDGVIPRNYNTIY